MVNGKASLYLLAFPMGLMGVVQFVFALLSLIIFNDHVETGFFESAGVLIVAACGLFVFSRNRDISRISYRDAMIFAVATWVITGVTGAIPILLITHVSFTDAVFESVSGLTTTGATILSGLDGLPKTFLLYRQFLQWLGGLGVVIFVVAILPMLNVGGMKLLKAEVPGPIKNDKLSPRIANTAHYLWAVYLILTLACAMAYYIAGMNGFDAIAHSLTTVSTGGFSTHDASMGYFKSQTILAVSDVFMLLGAINFALHFRAMTSRNIRYYFQDEETRNFIYIVIVLSTLISVLLLVTGQSKDLEGSFSIGFFHLISFLTSTGYGADNYTQWPASIIMLLVVAGYLGGCAGSTAGGNKIIRNILCIKLIKLEFRRLIHPRGVFSVKFQHKPVELSVLQATGAFMFFSALSTIILTLLLMLTGLDFLSSLTAVAACLNVLGPAFGELGSNFQPVSDSGTWLLSCAMIIGRLEYFTVFALFIPGFWRF